MFWVDERVVPKDHADSNYKLASDEFLSKVITCTVKFRICFDRERWDFVVSIDLLFFFPTRGYAPDFITGNNEITAVHNSRFDTKEMRI